MSNTSRQNAGIAAAVVAVAMAAAVGIGSLMGGDSASTTVANNAALTPIEQTAETPTVTTDEPDETQADSAEDEATSSTGAASSIAAPAASGESATSDTPAQTDAPATAPSRSNARRRAPSNDADVSGIITVKKNVKAEGGLSKNNVNTTVYLALTKDADTDYLTDSNGNMIVKSIRIVNGVVQGDAVFEGLEAGHYEVWELALINGQYARQYNGMALVGDSFQVSSIYAESTSTAGGNDAVISADDQVDTVTFTNTYAQKGQTTSFVMNKMWADRKGNTIPAPDGARIEFTIYSEINGVTKEVRSIWLDGKTDADGEKSPWQATFENLPSMTSSGQSIKYKVRETTSVPNYYPFSDMNIRMGENSYKRESNGWIINKYLVGDIIVHKHFDIQPNMYDGTIASRAERLHFTLTNNTTGQVWTFNLSDFDNINEKKDETDFHFRLSDMPFGDYTFEESGYRGFIPNRKWDEANSKTSTTSSFPVNISNEKPELSDLRLQNKYISGTDESDGVAVHVTKTWDDMDDAYKKRPASVSFELLANGEKYVADGVTNPITLNAGVNWYGKWENLPEYDSNGKAVTYTVREISVAGYKTTYEVTGTYDKVYNFTNRYESSASETPQLVVNKTLNGTAPTAEKFTFVATGEDGTKYHASNVGGTVTFTDLPKIEASDFKDTDTITRTYTVREEPGEDQSITYDSSTYTAVLTAKFDAAQDRITYLWSYPSKVLTADYEDNKDGTVKVTFYSNGSVVKAETVTVANLNDGDNRYTYEENNETCTITLTKITTEDTTKPLVLDYDASTGKITAKLNGVQLGDGEFTVENSDGLSISNDKIVTIPAPNGETKHTVTATAKKDGKEYKASLEIVVKPKANALQVTYHDLGDGRGWFEVHHNSSDVSNHDQDLSITPTNGGPECIGYTNGTKAVDFSSANLSAGTHQYKYEVSHGGESVYVTVTVEVTEGSKPELSYELSYTNYVWSLKTATFKAAGNQYDGNTVILVYGTPPNNLNNKVLNVSNGSATTNDPLAFKWTESFNDVVFQVLPGWQQSPIISGNISSENESGTLYGDPVKTYASTGMAEASADYQYVSQDCHDNEFTTKESSITKFVTSPALIDATPTAPTFVNTKETSTVDVAVTKVWDDADNQDGIRPDSVSVQLKANGDPSGDVVTLPEGNNWTHTWEGLPEKDASGANITYAVEEVNVPEGYSSSGPGTAKNNYTITNTHVPETTEAKVVKVWDDADNADGLRPGSLDVTLSDGQTSQTVTLNESNGWQATITGLPKYADGTLIPYTWTEAELPDGYTLTDSVKAGTVTTITNTHTPQTTSIKVTKSWQDDNNDANSTRKPITVHLFNASGTEVGSKIISASDNWTATFDNLPVIVGGTAVNYADYSLTEDPVEGYTSTVGHITKNDDGTYSVQVENTLKPVNLTVTKTVTGAMADMTKEFEFSISVNDGTAQPFKLKHDGQLTPEAVASLVGRRLHYGDKVTITETAAAGYTTTYTVNRGTARTGTSTGELRLTADTTVAFTNDKDSVAVTGIAETIATSPLVHIIAVGLVTAAACVAITRARRERGVR